MAALGLPSTHWASIGQPHYLVLYLCRMLAAGSTYVCLQVFTYSACGVQVAGSLPEEVEASPDTLPLKSAIRCHTVHVLIYVCRSTHAGVVAHACLYYIEWPSGL